MGYFFLNHKEIYLMGFFWPMALLHLAPYLKKTTSHYAIILIRDRNCLTPIDISGWEGLLFQLRCSQYGVAAGPRFVSRTRLMPAVGFSTLLCCTLLEDTSESDRCQNLNVRNLDAPFALASLHTNHPKLWRLEYVTFWVYHRQDPILRSLVHLAPFLPFGSQKAFTGLCISGHRNWPGW